jgi:transposase
MGGVSAAPPPLEPAQLRATLLALLTAGQPETAVDTVLQLLTALQDHATALAQRVAQLLKQTYGRRSEQVDPAQLRLLLAALAGAPTESPAAAATAPTLPAPPPRAPRRPPTGRRPLPADLPREEQVHTPPERERHCAGCDQPKACIGVERSEVLEWLPATFKVIVHLREKYACPRCQDGVVIAPVPEKVIDGGRPGPGLLAHVLVAKYRDHVPLYCLAGIYARGGVALAPSTLGGWVAEGAELLTPVADAIYATVLDAHVLQIDDTGLRVLDRRHPGGVKKGHLWGLVGDGRLVAFAYTPSWEGAAARALVETRRGWLHADGYAGFDQLFTRPGATAVEVGCWAHTRRKFFEAMEAGDLRAALAVERIQQLYRLEREATARGFDAAARLALRQAQATRSSTPSASGSPTSTPRRRRGVSSARRCATPSTSGRRSAASWRTGRSPSIPTASSARCARSRWVGKIGSSRARMRARGGRRSSTRSSARVPSVASSRGPTRATSWRK